jgi:hypothetical protein
MTCKRAITLSLVLPFLLLVGSAIGEPANTPEDLIHELDASAKAKDADRFLSQLTNESHKKVNDWLASQADLQRAQDDFRKALDEKFPESRTKEASAPQDIKQVLGSITSLELVSQKEGPDGTMELRVKTTRRTPEGKTVSHEDTFVAQKENGAWKLKIDPGPPETIAGQKAALERVTASVRNQEFHDRPTALLELSRVQLQQISNKADGVGFATKTPPSGGLRPLDKIPPASSKIEVSSHPKGAVQK